MKPQLPPSRRNLIETAFGLGCLLASAVPVARAASASDTWDAGAGNNQWQDVLNWMSDATMPGVATNTFNNPDDATFGTVGSGAIDLQGQINLRSVIFGVLGNDASAFTIGDANDIINFTTLGGVTVNAGVTNAQQIGSAGTALNLSTDANSTVSFTNNGTGLLTVAGNVVAVPPTGNSLLAVGGSGNSAITGTITETGAGGSALLKTGTGTLTLSNGSSFTGAGAIGYMPATPAGYPMVVREGTLKLNGGTHAVDTELVIGGVVTNGGAGQNAKIQVDSGTLTVGSWLSIGRGNGTGGVSSDLILNGTSAVNAVNLSGGYNGGNGANLVKGSVVLNDSAILTVTNNNGNYNWGESTGSNFTMTLNGSSKLVHNGNASGTRVGNAGMGILDIASGSATVDVRNLIIGQGTNGIGAVYNKGTLKSVGMDGLFLGDGATSVSYFRNDNAAAAVANDNAANIISAIGSGANSVVDVISGTLTGTRVGACCFNNNVNNSQFNVTGGTLGAGTTGFVVADSTARTGNKWANVNVTGSGIFQSTGAVNLSLPNLAGNVANFSITSGGIMAVDTITSTGPNNEGYLNFNNGTLRANSATTAQIATANVDRITVYSGGMTIDTNGFNKTMAASVATPVADGATTYGVTSISLSGTGTSYEARPIVKITGGGGTGATAMANFDLATGQVTGVTVTSPGSGYTSAPTVAILGGGGTALTGTAAIGAVAGGSLTKTGTGTLTWNGAHAFTGPIIVSNGELATGGLHTGSALTVNSGGRLNVADAAGAIGTLTVGTLTLDSGALLTLETGASNASDKIVCTGGSHGSVSITLYDTGTTNPALAGTYTLIQYSGSFTGGTAGLTVANQRPGYTYNFADTGTAITVAVVPTDTDGDEMTDLYEISNGLDPNDATGVNGKDGNLDGDFATNYQEFLAGTAANNAAQDPLNTDNDGLPDAWEVTAFGSAATQIGSDDSDGDFDTNLAEYTANTGGANAASFSDTDTDGLADGWEILYFGSIAAKNGTVDSDGDLFTDTQEYKYGSNPTDSSHSPAFAKAAHRWSFDGNLNDSVGTSNATIQNGATSNTNVVTQNATNVKLAGGVKADSQWVKLGANLLPAHNTPVTIELWATMDAIQNWSRIFDFHSGPAENLFMSWSQGTTAASDRVEWRDAAVTSTNNTNNWVVGTKYHIVMTIEPAPVAGSSVVKWYSAPAYDGESYLDLGAPRGTVTVANAVGMMNDTINALGHSPYNDNAPSATYDEVRIWDGAMRDWALEALYEQGPGNSVLADTDNDKLPDAFEMFYFDDLAQSATSDGDGDQSSNIDELYFGSDPSDASSSPNDSDADGLPDAWEMFHFNDLDEIASGDPDGDRATNAEELAATPAPTNPTLYTSFPDTDNDGMSDGWEFYYVGSLANSGTGDTDGDGFNLLAEFTEKGAPDDPLTPGVADGDADNDGLPDRWETTWFTPTTIALQNGTDDSDSDTFSNLAEYQATSDPSSATSTPSDINGDGTPDNHVFHGMTASGAGVQDKDGEGTPFTTRLAGTGTTIPAVDPNLDLDTAAGTLALTSSSSDINGQVNMQQLEAIGIPLSSLGFTATQDFRIRAHYVNLPVLGGFDQIGAWVGTSSTSMTRAAAIFGNYAALGVNTNAATDSNAFFGAGNTAGAAGRDLTIVIERIGGTWSMTCNGNACNATAQPAFLNGLATLQAGVFVLDQNAHKTATLESFTAVSFAAASGSADTDTDGMEDSWETEKLGGLGRDGTGDLDGDGILDLAEFAFNGEPNSGASLGTVTSALTDTNGNTQRELTLTIAVRTGATFAVQGDGSQLATVGGVTYRVRGSIDLANFNSAVTHVSSVASGTAGWDLHTFRLNASDGLGGKGFLQAVATHP
jgi:autotransporter-associated beta strand protein